MRIVLTGASGQLGAYLLDELIGGPHQIAAWCGTSTGSRAGLQFRPVNLENDDLVASALSEADPELVIHAAAVSSAEAVYRDRDKAWSINVAATRRIADWAARHDRRVVYTSTDLVFDGGKSWYREDDTPQPVLAYGQSKHAAEQFVISVRGGLVARLGLLFGPSRCGKEGFYDRALAALRVGQPRDFFIDEFRTPTDYVTAARILIQLALSDATGMIHVAGQERLSRFDLMHRVAIAQGIDPVLVRPNRRDDVSLPEPRPADVSLDTTRLTRLFRNLGRPSLETAVARFA